MGMKKHLTFLVDSVIIIDHLNGAAKATKWLEDNLSKGCAISFITRAEVLAGAEDNEIKLIKMFLDSFISLNIDNNIADLAAELRRKNKLKLPDAFQAAISIKNKLKLVTRNTKDFNPDLEYVLIPYTI